MIFVLPEPSTSSSKARKKVQTHIISFEDDDSEDEIRSNYASTNLPSTSYRAQNVTTMKKDIVNASSSSTSGEVLVQSDKSEFDAKPISWPERYFLSLVDLISYLFVRTLKFFFFFFNSETLEEDRLLTPLTDTENMGGLVPVSPLDNSLEDVLVSLPSYIDVS